MGWSYTYRGRGWSNLDWFCRQWGDGRTGNAGVVDLAGNGLHGPLYVAYRHKNGNIVPIICLISWDRGADYNFGHKDIGADGAYTQCPKRILKLLTHDALSDHSKEWVAKCEAWHAKKKKRTTVSTGDTVILSKPIDLTRGGTLTVFRVMNSQRLHWRYGMENSPMKGKRWLLEEPHTACILKNGKGYTPAGEELPTRTTRSLKKGEKVILANGWTAHKADNMNRGIRTCLYVNGWFPETGDVWSHEVLAVIDSEEDEWNVLATIEHTDAQKKVQKEVG